MGQGTRFPKALKPLWVFGEGQIPKELVTHPIAGSWGPKHQGKQEGQGWVLGTEGQVLRAESAQATFTDDAGLRWAVLVFKGAIPHAVSLGIAVPLQGEGRGTSG